MYTRDGSINERFSLLLSSLYPEAWAGLADFMVVQYCLFCLKETGGDEDGGRRRRVAACANPIIGPGLSTYCKLWPCPCRLKLKSPPIPPPKTISFLFFLFFFYWAKSKRKWSVKKRQTVDSDFPTLELILRKVEVRERWKSKSDLTRTILSSLVYKIYKHFGQWGTVKEMQLELWVPALALAAERRAGWIPASHQCHPPPSQQL